ncbi:MAG: TonB-dependent receptor [Candidatus Thiodiazotropha sp. (ex Dulcina madagascariensis)]|nr:TonB-dependent receptor [Candidatus Thiodiazotropha sp. (ex Dulcina madagascariensis)]MCU7928082.1 TonB-dependent receptor [Candidatus Thiodiazotropha sp. (ex Dulcina madagascariensis)]
MKIIKTASVLALLSCWDLSLADEFPGGDEGFYEGGEGDVIYLATKTPKRLVKAPAIATVITAEEIRNMGARTLAEILKIRAGIILRSAKDLSIGYETIEVRGVSSFTSENILLLIDGHRASTINYGGSGGTFSEMFVENIKRIELIRGPGSALYGNSAFVATINVVTKDAAEVDGLQVLAGAGSFNTRHGNLLFGKEHSGLEIAGHFDYLQNDSPELRVEQDALGMSGVTENWRERYDAGLNVAYGNFDFKGRYVSRKAGAYIGVVNALNDESDIEFSHLFGELSYKRQANDQLDLLVKAYADWFTFRAAWELFSEGVRPGFPDGMLGTPERKERTFGVELQLDYAPLDYHTITMGAQYEYKKQYDVKAAANFNPVTGAPLDSMQDISSWANYNKNEDRSIAALYIQDIWEMTPTLEGTFGIRYDHYSDFGDTVNPRAALVWGFMKEANLKLLYGSAFQAPNFEQLYNINNPAHTGNPDLDPEKVRTYEASVGYFPKNLLLNLTYFHSDFKDLIIWKDGLAQNSSQWTIDGIEVEAKADFRSASYYANYTWQDPREDDTGERLPETPDSYGNIGFNWELNRYLNLNANLLMVGARSRADTDTRSELAGYEVVDLTLIGKNFFGTAEIRASIHNLLDEEYADPAPVNTVASDFPREGISFMVDLSYKF